ncbi:MAG: T9SS type A sorting domain-containing protein, partial [Salibacteraceae bacterium]
FDKDYDTNKIETYKKHLGLYLSNSDSYSNVNGFTGTLGGAENIFTHFANLDKPCTAPAYNSHASTHTVPAPGSGTTLNQPMYTYDIIKLTNVVADNLYEIESTKLSTAGSTTDKITIRQQTPTGRAIAFDNGKFIFKPQTNDDYYIIVKKSDCSVHNGSPSPSDPIPSQYQRNIIIKDLGNSGFANTDPNPGPISEYSNNIPVGYCWYRYADLNMIWNTSAGTPWAFYKTNETNSKFNDEEEIKNNDFTIYPNPVSSEPLTIEGEGILRVEIFDIQGHKLLSQINGLNIDVSKLPSGLFQVRIITNNGYFIKTISKIK